MNSLFFWIIVLSFLVPLAMRMYRKSVNRRNQDQGFPGGYPGQFPGGRFPGPQDRRPRDGYTQQDYLSGGFRQISNPQPLPPAEPLPPLRPVPPMDQQYPPSGQQVPDPRLAAPQQPAVPATPPPPSAPLGFRARKLAELDQQYSSGGMAVDEYMKRRSEIMDG